MKLVVFLICLQSLKAALSLQIWIGYRLLSKTLDSIYRQEWLLASGCRLPTEDSGLVFYIGYGLSTKSYRLTFSTRILASTTVIPCGVAISGLKSSSFISVAKRNSPDSFTIISANWVSLIPC